MAALALAVTAVAPDDSTDAASSTHKPPVHGSHPTSLLGVDSLKGTCFGFPHKAFAEGNSITDLMPHDPTVWMKRGESAIDFVAMTSEEPASRIALSQLLTEGKPVVVTYGMFTCPAFQGYYIDSAPKSHFSKYDEWALVEQYKDKVNFVHVYTAEPHPRQPDANFDKGIPIEFPWSTVRQARTLDMRRKNAKMIAADLHEEEYLLVDDLGEGLELKGVSQPANDPVWCSYGPGARLSVLFHSVTMAVAIEELLLMSDKLASPGELAHLRHDAGVDEAFNSSAAEDATAQALDSAADATQDALSVEALEAQAATAQAEMDARAEAKAEAQAAALEAEEESLYANYKPALSVSDEQLATILGRDHQEERMKALSQIRHFTIKYAKFRSNKLSSRHEQGLPPPKSQAKRSHAAELADAQAAERREAAEVEAAPSLAARADPKRARR